jgi:hypothetical protein
MWPQKGVNYAEIDFGILGYEWLWMTEIAIRTFSLLTRCLSSGLSSGLSHILSSPSQFIKLNHNRLTISLSVSRFDCRT